MKNYLFNQPTGTNITKMSLRVSLTDPTATYETDDLYTDNITHNLTEMADAAGIYNALWRPYRLHEEFKDQFGDDYEAEWGFENEHLIKASTIIPLLENAIGDLRAKRKHYEQYNPGNGWGSYGSFVKFVADYLAACQTYPDSFIEVSR